MPLGNRSLIQLKQFQRNRSIHRSIMFHPSATEAIDANDASCVELSVSLLRLSERDSLERREISFGGHSSICREISNASL